MRATTTRISPGWRAPADGHNGGRNSFGKVDVFTPIGCSGVSSAVSESCRDPCEQNEKDGSLRHPSHIDSRGTCPSPILTISIRNNDEP
jgi:hypothetical protein